jgi:phosphatidylserine decarboxylase
MSAFVTFQKLLPQHLLSRTVGAFAASEMRWISAPFIRAFAKAYSVNMAEVEHPDFASYRSFNDFFTRALTPTARPIDAAPATLACPADGTVSQAGTIEHGELLQAKGIRYSFEALADACAGPEFEGGPFLTVYLSPKDYHRVHVPAAGRLTRSIAVPGKLFSVNPRTEAEVVGLFARNERLVSEFATPFGKMLVIMVGALLVASIETTWGGPRSPYAEKQTGQLDVAFAKGGEMGRFLMGSTVIVAFEKGRVELDAALTPGATVRMGQHIGTVRQA